LKIRGRWLSAGQDSWQKNSTEQKRGGREIPESSEKRKRGNGLIILRPRSFGKGGTLHGQSYGKETPISPRRPARGANAKLSPRREKHHRFRGKRRCSTGQRNRKPKREEGEGGKHRGRTKRGPGKEDSSLKDEEWGEKGRSSGQRVPGKSRGRRKARPSFIWRGGE